jgi:hypothetical protein
VAAGGLPTRQPRREAGVVGGGGRIDAVRAWLTALIFTLRVSRTNSSMCQPV